MFRCFGKLQSGFTVLPVIEQVTDAVSWTCGSLCWRSAESVWQVMGSFSTIQKPSFSFPQVSLVACAVGLKHLDSVLYGGNRNIGVSGDVLVALRLSKLDYEPVIRWCSALLSSVHALIAVFLTAEWVISSIQMDEYLILQAFITHHRTD